MKLLSLFSGIGAFERGFEMAKFDFELVNYCEYDNYASKSYSAIHNTSEEYNLGDITLVDETKLPDFDIMTYGFPCQDVSIAGLQKGINEETRSGLLYHALRIAKHKKPKVMIAENVKGLVSKRFLPDFNNLLSELSEMGYTNYWQVLNAKDYGIPQNRERVFIVSIAGSHKPFEFPNPYDNGIRLKDLLDIEVEEKFFISDEKVQKILNSKFNQERDRIQTSDISSSLLARDYKDPKCVAYPNECKFLGNIYSEKFGTGYAGGVWDKEHISPTLTTMQGGGRQPHIFENVRIRKYTPTECFKLMGFTSTDIEKCKKVGISNSQLYKQAGNSIVTTVVAEIAVKLKEALQ